jgi:hypothetical protein
MPFAANPSRSNRVLRSIVAFLCLTATLLIATPCNASATPHHAASMTAAHCSACCPAAPISAAPLCCQANSEPAQPISLHPLPGALPNLQAVAVPGLTPLIAALITTPPAQPAPPPLLHPILRI